MSYIQRADYKKLIQSDNLDQIINNDASILDGIELLAQAEISAYLIQKYIVAEEFADLLTWSVTAIYKAKQRVTLDAVAYSAAALYVVNDLALMAGKVYRCITAITTAEAFNISKWELIGPQYAIYFATLPKPQFNFDNVYAKGDQVFWRDKVYTNIIPTAVTAQEEAIQYPSYATIPPRNVFPDDPVTGVLSWGTGVDYSVAAGTLPTNTTKWTKGDNRDQQLLTYTLDIALYHVHSRIAPRNIPDLRVKRYDDAKDALRRAAKGEITMNLPRIQPKTASGSTIRWGSKPKRINNY